MQTYLELFSSLPVNRTQRLTLRAVRMSRWVRITGRLENSSR